MKKTLSIIFIALFIIALSSCSMLLNVEKEKAFEKSGMSITLTNQFTEKEHLSYTSIYDSKNMAVYTLKEEFSLFEAFDSDLTLDEYADLVVEANKLTCEKQYKDDLTYFLYEKEANGKQMSFYAFVYEGDDAFWLIQFACESDNAEKLEDRIFTYAKSVNV